MRNFLAAQRPRFFLWSPAGLMLGIAAYFYPDSEPPLWLGAAMLLVSIMLLALLWRRDKRWLAMPLLLMALGFAAAQWRAHLVATPLLTQELPYRIVEGTIDEIEPQEERIKLVLSHPMIEGITPERTPRRLRISFRDDGGHWQVGDRVRLVAALYPLPQQAMPGSYDFARYFYFRSIGGNGYAVRAPSIIEAAARLSARDRLNNLRHAIGEDMRLHMPGAVGAVAAAMTVGETGPIPAEAKALLRDAGLAHMLAIAGLHLGIVAGIVFFNARLLLSLWPALALRLPVKKIAACLALISAFVYLLLAGCPIPAQRAFIMVAFLFTAVLLDRKGVTLRTLAFAALLILLLFPEAMYGASFQMSFAATLAIVILFETFTRLRRREIGWARRITAHGLSIIATSLVATLATAPFVLYNFNRFALFGLLANMAVIPLATFVIMPGVVLSLLLMPLGLQQFGYIPLQYGTQWMLHMAGWVTALPYAALRLPAPSDAGLAACAFGLMLLCLLQGRGRLLGIPVTALGLMTLALHVPPDVLISHDARQIMVRTTEGHYAMLKGSGRSFTVQSWLRAEGQEEIVPLEQADIHCDALSCTYRHNGHRLVLAAKEVDGDALDALCRKRADVLVAWRYLRYVTCTGPKELVGRRQLEMYGAHALWFHADGVRVAYGRGLGQDQRLWQVPLPDDL